MNRHVIECHNIVAVAQYAERQTKSNADHWGRAFESRSSQNMFYEN